MILTTSNVIALDLADFNRRGFFKTDTSSGKFSWQYSAGEVIAEFTWTFKRTADSTLTIQYAAPCASGSTRDVTETIQLSTTPCRFGGVRYWAKCASCECRVRRLYLTHNNGKFSCAKCNRLICPSQMPMPKGMSDFVQHMETIEDLEARMSRLRSPKRIAAIQDRIERLLEKLKGVGYQGRRKVAWQSQ